MTKKMHAWSLAALPLAIGLASFTGSANAVTFNVGEVRGQFDSQLSIGASMSTTDADRRFIHFQTPGQNGQAVARTSDDGRQNYESGDFFSKIFRGVHDLQFTYGDSGAFLRGKYWYDAEIKDGSQRFYDVEDDGRPPLVKGAGAALLDAFVYHNYTIGENPGNVRLGRQVVSWGESTFIQNSINSINPVDVAAFRRPGAEIKEGLLPVEMLYVSQGLTDNLSMEAFYQLRWEPFAIDNCGTFFGADTLATGCVDRLVFSGADSPQGDPTLNGRIIVRAEKDRDASDDGQFGVAFRYYAAQLNDTEFGFYAMNYHSRAPFYSNIQGPFTPLVANNNPNTGLGGLSGGAGYFFEYPEDIRLYGVSFATNIAGTAVSGEVSYRPNMPLQITTGSMSLAGLTGSGAAIGRNDTVYTNGEYIQGYDRAGVYQAQMTAIHFIERVLGASRLALVGEVGYNHIEGIDLSDGSTFYGRDSLFGQAPTANGSCASQAAAPFSKYANSWCESDGFYTSDSWGYRVRASLDYSNVFLGVNLSPNVTFSHDVEGYGPNFTENAKAINVGLNADYGNKYTASLSYTDFFDGKYNTNVDRDFASASVSVNF
ncbi:DUF1302 domain-containing protein [Halopseudomonas sp.]|uniref:DUF1302 domain-containing protein n=1 Tax=Halopseudomonas sp. TaxID=2901191 RepID=UPI003563D71C